jgi:uncharacterized repeat protein (TIGR01451 family)
MKQKGLQIIISTLMLLGLVLAPFGTGGVSAKPVLDDGQPTPDKLTSKIAPAVTEAKYREPAISSEQALAKIQGDLREQAAGAGPALSPSEAVDEPLLVRVVASPGLDLSPYFVDGKVYARPVIGKGDDLVGTYYGQVYAHNLLKIATLADVGYIFPVVLEKDGFPDDYPIDDEKELPERGPEDWAALQANAEKTRESFASWDRGLAAGDLATEDWFEVMPEGPHKAQAAWDRGYRGEGVTVAVLDDGIDAAHPDLIGTQKIYSSTTNTQYNGWPMVFSPIAQLLYFNDEFYGDSYLADGFPGLHYVDTSATPTLTPCGAGVRCFNFTPLLDYGLSGTMHTYFVPTAYSLSGVVHVGTHPDNDLRDFVWGEKPAVLVADPNTAGVYDTVFVDLNDNYDFSDDVPLTRADTTNATTLDATYNDMVAGMDMNGDGLADISAGMLYFIADGSSVLPASDYMWGAACPGFMCPGNGDLVAFSGGTFDGPYSHGTQCASNVVGQGVTQNASLGLSNDFLPTFRDLGPGKPSAAVFGMAPEAKMVNVSDIYWDHVNSTVDAYLFAAIGYDGLDQWDPGDTDAIQANSNSYGNSATDNDGWDYRGQVVNFVQRYYAPNLQYLFSTGNGAPGYGTASPPSPETGIGVGASTEYGSTGWDTITDTNQIMNNDVVAFSNSGPGAREGSGADVLAGGAFAAGAEELNYYAASTWGTYDGNMSWVSWGGTSRSAPVAMGVLALLYQAYEDAHGVWPYFDDAKALLMSSATDLNSNVFRQGAGSVNADAGTAAASGDAGTYMAYDSSDWQPGDYLGNDWPGFAHIVYPGDTWNKGFTVVNDTAADVTVGISDATLELINEVEVDFTVTAAMNAAENADNFYKAFHYMIPITATASADASMQNIAVPPGTDMMVVRQMFPFDEFDANRDYSWDNRFYLMVYNWKDVDGDGIVWDDKDGNGVVNFINDTAVTLIDYGTELVWDDPITELDRWEYGRFGYNRPSANTNELIVHDPLERMHDGLFIGLRHHPGSTYTGDTHLKYRIEFYQKADVPWLTTSVTNLLVPAGSTAGFDGEINVPLDMLPGDYEAAIEVLDPSGNNMVIPVVMNVAAEFDGSITFGGTDQYLDDYGHPYNNAAVRGYQEWGWRAESGDWRMFYLDVPDTFPEGEHLIIRDVWEDSAPVEYTTDIDTIVLGPTEQPIWDCWYCGDDGFWGPYALDTVAKSPNTNVGAGTWLFDTSTGRNEDWVMAPLQHGLHRILEHNVLFQGDQFDVVFTKTVGMLSESVHEFDIETYKNIGDLGDITLESTLDLNGLEANAYIGLLDETEFINEPINFVSSNTIEWTEVFTVSDGVSLQAWTSSPDISDIDLYLFYWNGTTWEQRASSTTGTADEYVGVFNPEDGNWLIGINNWSGPTGHFNMLVEIVSRSPGITVSGLPSGAVPADTPVTLSLSYDIPMEAGNTYYGTLELGPPEAQGMKEVPIAITRMAESADIGKVVDHPTAFPGDELVYTVDLFNYSDADALFEFVDPIPDGTDFVSVSGVVPGPESSILFEDFEGVFTSTWTIADNAMAGGAVWSNVAGSGETGNWTGGTGDAASASSDQNLGAFDTELWSPAFDLPAGGFARVDYLANFQDLSGVDFLDLDISTDGGSSWTNLLRWNEDHGVFRSSGEEVSVDLSAYTGMTGLILRWHYYSTTGTWQWYAQVDDVEVVHQPADFFTYDAGSNSVLYDGLLPLSDVIPGLEGFEEGMMPPTGWMTDTLSSSIRKWTIVDAVTYPDFVHSGDYAAWVNYDAAATQDEWLSSPVFSVTGDDHMASFWAVSDTLFPGATTTVYAMDASGTFTDTLWDLVADETWSTFEYRQVELDLSSYVGQDILLAWRYHGLDGESFGLDDIRLPGMEDEWLPAATAEITVEINNTVSDGDWITNTGTVTATHEVNTQDGPMLQSELPVWDDAMTHIGVSENGSYKSAPAAVEPGDLIEYEIHVVNNGDALASVSFTDTVPANTTFFDIANYPPAGFDYDPVGAQVTWSGNIGPFEELVFTYWVQADYDLSLGTEIVNDATLVWNGEAMSLMATTEIVFLHDIFLPYAGVE